MAIVAVACGLALGACAVWPERWAVNAPMTRSLFGLEWDPIPSEVMGRIQTPEGFAISTWATGLPNARFLRITPSGDLLVSQPRLGRITLLGADADGDGAPDARLALLEGLNRPHGLDLYDGWLYVGEADAIVRVRFDPVTRHVSGPIERVVTDLPTGGNHWTRTVRFGPDGWMYVSIGSSCNACEEEDERRATLMRFRPDGSAGEIYASGLRNTVGFDWDPRTGILYGTDNGRDLLGDDTPPCELNRIERGGDYGWPVAYGDKVPDPELGKGHSERISTSRPTAHAFAAHTAPLGITFLRAETWPAPYRGAALVSLHGSWNRTRKQGYEVVSLHFGERGSIAERKFVHGFELNGDVIGRPVDVAEGPDGAVYVSDDYTGSIYRVAYGEGSTHVAAKSRVRDETAAEANPLAGMDPTEREARAAQGKQLYERWYCAQCHEGMRASEGVVVVELKNLSQRYRVEDLMAFLAAPTPPMPALDLEEEQRRDLAVYLLAKHP
jgi:glucose/arabinose dehydrogenase/mono/diheme cytochrome c family protein